MMLPALVGGHAWFWTAESLHYGWTLSMQELIVSV
jgi:hypothetical protein